MIELFKNVLNEYEIAYGQKFAEHPIANLIRHDIPKTISDLLRSDERYTLKGSAGAGNWSHTPWIAIFDILVTDTAQSGYYPVFLFRDDMSGFYLSLNQGVTEIKEKYKRDAKIVLEIKAEDYRAQLTEIPANFNQLKINLRSNTKATKSPLSKLYEAGNILAKYYSAYSLPSNDVLVNDIREILKIYDILSYNEGLPTTPAEKENDESDYGYEDLKKFRLHKRIERNINLSKKVKEKQGYKCSACEVQFEDVYGDLGNKFIETHHLTPFSKLKGEKIKLNVKTDFTVLCSNCHSMIHRMPDPSNIDLLKAIIIKYKK